MVRTRQTHRGSGGAPEVVVRRVYRLEKTRLVSLLTTVIGLGTRVLTSPSRKRKDDPRLPLKGTTITRLNLVPVSLLPLLLEKTRSCRTDPQSLQVGQGERLIVQALLRQSTATKGRLLLPLEVMDNILIFLTRSTCSTPLLWLKRALLRLS